MSLVGRIIAMLCCMHVTVKTSDLQDIIHIMYWQYTYSVHTHVATRTKYWSSVLSWPFK